MSDKQTRAAEIARVAVELALRDGPGTVVGMIRSHPHQLRDILAALDGPRHIVRDIRRLVAAAAHKRPFDPDRVRPHTDPSNWDRRGHFVGNPDDLDLL